MFLCFHLKARFSATILPQIHNFSFFLVFLKITTRHFFLCILSTFSLFSNCSSHLCADETRAPRQSTTKGLGNAQEQADLQITLLCAPPCLHIIAPLPSNSVEFSTFSMINHAPIPTLPFSSTEKRKKKITFLPAKTSAFPRQNPANGKQEKLGCKTKRTQSGIKSWN